MNNTFLKFHNYIWHGLCYQEAYSFGIDVMLSSDLPLLSLLTMRRNYSEMAQLTTGKITRNGPKLVGNVI